MKTKAEQVDIIKSILGKKESDEYIFRFGEYNGKPISEVPVYYLNWVVKNVSSGMAASQAEIELDKRKRQ